MNINIFVNVSCQNGRITRYVTETITTGRNVLSQKNRTNGKTLFQKVSTLFESSKRFHFQMSDLRISSCSVVYLTV
jgi:hypothetical protein